jgi:hypothetical protein
MQGGGGGKPPIIGHQKRNGKKISRNELIGSVEGKTSEKGPNRKDAKRKKYNKDRKK